MKPNDHGMGELLDLLKTHPDLISALVFDTVRVKRLLKTKAARKLALGVDTKAFLKYIAGPMAGSPIGLCSQRTAMFCPGTRFSKSLGVKRPADPDERAKG